MYITQTSGQIYSDTFAAAISVNKTLLKKSGYSHTKNEHINVHFVNKLIILMFGPQEAIK